MPVNYVFGYTAMGLFCLACVRLCLGFLPGHKAAGINGVSREVGHRGPVSRVGFNAKSVPQNNCAARESFPGTTPNVK
jgi:hypothetical protein